MPTDLSSAALAPELFWLAAVTVLTMLLWVPYTLLRIAKFHLWPSLQNRSPATTFTEGVGVRLEAAHANAIENLPVFAALVLVALIAQRTSPLTATAAMVFFWARLAHFLIYAAGIPVARTLAFAIGWAACAAIALHIFGLA